LGLSIIRTNGAHINVGFFIIPLAPSLARAHIPGDECLAVGDRGTRSRNLLRFGDPSENVAASLRCKLAGNTSRSGASRRGGDVKPAPGLVGLPLLLPLLVVLVLPGDAGE
jgi:hypothetical protein